MKNTALFTLTFILFINFSLTANPFKDIPESHWAYDAVFELESRGLFDNIADDALKGKKHITRYDVAETLAKFMAKNFKDGYSSYSDKEIENFINLIKELEDELSILGVKATYVQNQVQSLKATLKRISSPEAIASRVQKFNVSGDYLLDYYDFDYDNLTERGFRSLYTINVLAMPSLESRIMLQFFNSDMHWTNTAGNDVNKSDLIKLGFLQIDNFNFLGLYDFERATFGRQPFRLGFGLPLMARVDGVVLEGKDFNIFGLSEDRVEILPGTWGGGAFLSPNEALNTYGFEYELDSEISAYYVTMRNGLAQTMSPDNPVAPTTFNPNTLDLTGFTYKTLIDKKINLMAEYTNYNFDNDIITSAGITDDSFNAYRLNFNAQDWNFIYSVHEEGGAPLVSHSSIEQNDTSLMRPLYPHLGFNGNVEDMFFKYTTSHCDGDLSLIYEDIKENEGNSKIEVITLGYERNLGNSVDFGVTYSTLTPDSATRINVMDGLQVQLDDITGNTGTAGERADFIKMQLRYKF
ncbi:MAG: S-layer homology domain-containing protein [Candidatus Muiribacteriota bacterium]